MRSVRLPSLIALLGVLAAGCTTRTEPAASVNSLEAYASGSGASTLSPVAAPEPVRHRAAPAVRLPARLATAELVDEWRDGDSRSQEILLGGRGGAEGEIRFATGRRAALTKPTETMIRAELAAAFPGQAARVVTTPRYNGLGPYGLAVVAGPGERRCAYAWQWLPRTDARIRHRLGGGDAVWRLRLCRNDMALDDIAAALDRLDVGAPARAAGPRLARRTVRHADSAPRRTRVVVEEQLPAETGRYLAPVTAPAPNAPAGAKPARLDPTLPVEAYRGPAYRTSVATGAFSGRPVVPAATP